MHPVGERLRIEFCICNFHHLAYCFDIKEPKLSGRYCNLLPLAINSFSELKRPRSSGKVLDTKSEMNMSRTMEFFD